jgi:lipopolysaccharide assembly outer membrane protein LptD (OstA)
VAAWLASAPARGQDVLDPGEGPGGGQPFDVTADSVEFETQRSLYIARGNVRIRQPERTLTADWVAFSNETRQGVATGNVVVVSGGDTLYADVLHFEIDTLKGIVLDGRLDARGSEFRMTGQEVRRTSEETYEFEEASFTTCRCPADETEPWVIRAREADLEVGGYATARNTTLDVLGVPVLWLPWMRYPVKTDRETGFLFPTFGQSSRSGFDVGLPFFWAARENVNVIVEPHWLSDRGFKPEVEAEYVFGRQSYGQAFGSFIDDEDIDPDDVSTPFDSTRWGAEWLHDHHLPAGWRWKVDGRLVSDNLYTFDFRDFSRFRNDRYLEALTFTEKRFGLLGRYGFSAALQTADDMQNPDDQDRDDFLLQRLPDLRLTGLPQPVLPSVTERLLASFDVRYTHFTNWDDPEGELPTALGDDVFLDTGIDAIPDGAERDRFGRVVRLDGSVETRDGRVFTAAEYLAAFPNDPPLDVDGSADDFPPGPEGDGRFQEGEPLADTGHRFVANPRFLYPFRIADVVEVLPELGWYGTFYATDEQSGEIRNLFTAMIDVRSRLRRVVELPGVGRTVHLLEPRLTYTGIVADDQDGNPLFIPRPFVIQRRLRQLDPWNIVRDPADRIEDVQALTFGLGNRVYVPAAQEGAPPNLFADVSFSFQEDFEDDALRAFFVDATLFPWNRVRARMNFGWDFDQSELDEVLLQGGWFDEAGNDVRLTYRYLRDIPRFFESFRFDDERFEEFEEGLLSVNQIDLFTRLALTRHWGLTYRLRYSFEESLFLGNEGGIEYLSRCFCWAIRFEVGWDRSSDFEFGVRYRIIGLGDDTVRPFQNRRRRRSTDPLIEDT